MVEEQRGEEVARAIHGDRQFRRAEPPEAAIVAGQNVERVGRRIVERQRFGDDDTRSACAQRPDRRRRLAEVFHRRAGQPFQLEGVGRRDRRQRQGAVAEEFGDARGDISAAPDVADDRIAGVGRIGIGGADPVQARAAPPRRSPAGRDSPSGDRRSGEARRWRRGRRRNRRSCRRRTRARASRDSRYGSKTGRSSAATPRAPAAAAERPPPNCRRGRRRHATGWRGSARAWGDETTIRAAVKARLSRRFKPETMT